MGTRALSLFLPSSLSLSLWPEYSGWFDDFWTNTDERIALHVVREQCAEKSPLVFLCVVLWPCCLAEWVRMQIWTADDAPLISATMMMVSCVRFFVELVCLQFQSDINDLHTHFRLLHWQSMLWNIFYEWYSITCADGWPREHIPLSSKFHWVPYTLMFVFVHMSNSGGFVFMSMLTKCVLILNINLHNVFFINA